MLTHISQTTIFQIGRPLVFEVDRIFNRYHSEQGDCHASVRYAKGEVCQRNEHSFFSNLNRAYLPIKCIWV